MSDLISRHDMIDLVKHHMKHNPMKSVEFIQGLQDAYLRVLSDLNRMSPSRATLTDSEQRIFLSAMAREKEICKEFDVSHRSAREPYEDSLVHICNEIERKVKDALWT